MAKVIQRITTNIRATLLSFEVGESKLVYFNDVVDPETGNVIETGSKVTTPVWFSRYGTLKRTNNLDGRFKFSSSNDPLGTVITRLE